MNYSIEQSDTTRAHEDGVVKYLEGDMPEKAVVVLQAAKKMFSRHGFSATTTDMIQREAGVSKSTLYAHFQNKEGMFRAVIELECNRQIDRALFRARRGEGIRERLLSLATAYLDLLMSKETLALYRLTLEVSTSFPDLAELFYNSGPNRLFRVIQEVFEQEVQNGDLKIPSGQALPMARLFAAMVREPHLRYALFPEKEIPRKELDASSALAVDTFLAAYGAQ